MVTRRDYTAEGVEAARSVLMELVHLLGEYKDDIVVIGGWIPEVLLPQSRQFLEERKVSSWGIWEKEISRFDWHYDSVEECYLLICIKPVKWVIFFIASYMVSFENI